MLRRCRIELFQRILRTTGATFCLLVVSFSALIAEPRSHVSGLGHAVTEEGDTRKFLDLFIAFLNGDLSLTKPETRDLLVKIGGRLQDSGHLRPTILLAAKVAFQRGLLPSAITSENIEEYANQLTDVVDAELRARGATRSSTGIVYEDWASLSRRLLREVEQVGEDVLGQQRLESGFLNPNFVRAFERQTRSHFTSGNRLTILKDGPDSFSQRELLIRKAQSSIHILSWAFYDDATGRKFSDLLVEVKRANPKLSIKVMVDGQVSERNGYGGKVLRHLRENGIEVIAWRSTDSRKKYDGQHRKAFIVDGKFSIEGGMNFGDSYSHLAGPLRWRDTDVLVEGPGVGQAHDLFARLWNEQLGRPGHETLSQVHVSSHQTALSGETSRATLINHDPGDGENILRANLMAFEAAKHSIDIENAYFILDPAVFRALLRAKRRGVRVRILTNSLESIDVPEMAHIMVQSANRLVKNGIEVYLKKGNTLHSKFLNVDGVYSWVGSHNFHARSFRYEGEIIRAVLDPVFGKKVQRMFEADLKEASPLREQISLKENPMADFLGHWLYDQL